MAGLIRHQQDMAKRLQPNHDCCSLLHSQASERAGKQWLAAERVAVILRGRASAAGSAPFTPHDMRRTYISELPDVIADLATVLGWSRERDDGRLRPTRECRQAQSCRSRAVLPAAAGLSERRQK